ncbi:MAG: sulfatase-like hydrolase/transferase [Isosphaeraceae bacterium]
MADSLTDVGPQRTAMPDGVGPASILCWAAWSGLFVGGVGLLMFLAQSNWVDPRNYNMSRHFPWMFLASGLITQGAPGLLLAAFAVLRGGRLHARAAIAVLAFPFYLDLLFRWPIMTVACLLLAAGLAARTSSFLAARVSSFDRLVKRSLAAMGLVAGLIVGGSVAAEAVARGSFRASRPPSAGAPNVLLLVLDTVRAGSLSLYGHPRDTSPTLKRYAARGVRFDHAYSAAPWTAPSHAAMFTGRLPHELAVAWNRPLEASRPTLAARLRESGYDTGGFVANTTYCSYETGLRAGSPGTRITTSRSARRSSARRSCAGRSITRTSIPPWPGCSGWTGRRARRGRAPHGSTATSSAGSTPSATAGRSSPS